MDDLDRLIAEIGRVVRPGGLFLLITDVNHAPTITSRSLFHGISRTGSSRTLEIVAKKRFEKSSGVYQSLLEPVAYNDADPQPRYGVLSVKFTKPLQ